MFICIYKPPSTLTMTYRIIIGSTIGCLILLMGVCPSIPSSSNTVTDKNSAAMAHLIKAQIVDKKQHPIAGAIVILTNGPDSFQEIAAITNENGVFQLTAGQKSGVYTLSAHYDGQTKPFSIALPQKETTPIFVWE